MNITEDRKFSLSEMQSWTLDQKIDHSLGVIDQYLSRLDGKAYVSFSGGKDSTVLLDLCRLVKPDILAVFCNTGNEYPDIVKAVRATENVKIIYPKMKPVEVIAKYGFPLVSKETSGMLHGIRVNPNSLTSMYQLGIKPRPEGCKFTGKLANKWRYLIDEPFDISNKCCAKLKKEPFKRYDKESGLNPIIGVMASESSMRKATAEKTPCNVFSEKKNISRPLQIWTEKDIYEYIARRGIKLPDIYKYTNRTGCMFCGYGAQMKGDNRFSVLRKLYPKWYYRFMSLKNNGVTYGEALERVGVDLKQGELF